MSPLTPEGTFQTVAPAESPQTSAPAEPPQTSAPAEPPQTSAPAEPPQTVAPAAVEHPQAVIIAETPPTPATTETTPPALAAPSKSKKKRRSKKRTSVDHSDSDSDSSDEDSSKERKPGRQSPLTQHQQDLVRAQFPAWEKILREHELHLGKKDSHARDPDAVTRWIESTIYTIRTSPTFGTFNDTTKKLNKILKGMFRNYRNNTFIKKNKHDIIKKAIVNKRTTPDGVVDVTDVTDVAKTDALKAAEALASFKNPAPAKEIFREENDERIKQEAERLRTEAAEKRAAEGKNPDDFDSRKDDNRGGFYQRALSALWKQADQGLYEEKANSYDLYSNQEAFPKLIRTSLEALCQHGAMGPTEIFFMAGFRNEKNEVVICRMSCHPKDGDDQPGFLRSTGEERESATLTRRWYDYCNAHLPKHDVDETLVRDASSTYITTNEDAIPVLVKFDLRDFKPSHLCEILKTFLTTLWFHSWPQDQERASIPLLEIIAHPDDFYDTKKYKFPVAFAEIETLHITDLYTLADFLLSKSGVSCPDPFVFRKKHDINKRIAYRRRLQAIELSTGEEIVSYDAIHAHLPPSDHSVSSVASDSLLSTLEDAPSANNKHQKDTVYSRNPEELGEELSSSAPTPSAVSDSMLSSVPMASTPQNIPSISTDVLVAALSDTAAPEAGQTLSPSPSSVVPPVTIPQDASPDVAMEHSPNLPNSIPPPSSSDVVTLQDALVSNSSNPTPPVTASLHDAPVTVSAAVNRSSESQPPRQSRRSSRKKMPTSGGALAKPGSSQPVDDDTVVRRSSRAKSGKRANPIPESHQRPAKRPKKSSKGWVNFVPQPNGKLGLVNADGTIRGYVGQNSDGEEIVVDESGKFVELLPSGQ